MVSIVLIGYRGVGKSTIGKRLASSFDLPFVDSDEAILHFAGSPSVQSIWDEGGEAAWRALEEEVVLKLLQNDGVLALGGGAPGVTAIRASLMGRANVLYLTAPLEVLQERLEGGERPALSSGDAQILQERHPIYLECSSSQIDASGTIEETLNAAKAAVEELS
ncbi:MAG: shikimate kinase [Phycisphaerae bacterium]|nr:shikimate kinase [Phycisphaerae bacterium]